MLLSWLRQDVRYSYKKVALILFFSTASLLLVYGVFYFSISSVQKSERDTITKIALKRRTSDALTLPIFVEMLALHRGQEHFDRVSAEKRLHALGLFKMLSIKERKAGTLLIEYALHTPFLLSGDFSNVVISEEGHEMPYAPYFSPKRLPILYLGEQRLEERFSIVRKLLSLVEQGEVIRMDLSQIEAMSKAKREIVMEIKQSHATHLLRLSPIGLEEQLRNYFILISHFTKKRQVDLVIDFRLSKSAYIKAIF